MGLKKHAKSKKKDWSLIDKMLKRRKTIYISLEALVIWVAELVKMNENKVGRPYTYSESMILFLGQVKAAFGMTYRDVEGFMESIFVTLGLNMSVPHYSQIQRRLAKMGDKIRDELIKETRRQLRKGIRVGEIILVADTSGLKVGARGDWLRKKHGHERMGWVKIHIVTETSTGLVTAVSVTDERTGDAEMFPELLEETERDSSKTVELLDAAWRQLEKTKPSEIQKTWHLVTKKSILTHIRDMIRRASKTVTVIVPDIQDVPLEEIAKKEEPVMVHLITDFSDEQLKDLAELAKKRVRVWRRTERDLYGCVRDQQEILLAPAKPSEVPVAVISEDEGYIKVYQRVILPNLIAKAKEVRI